MNILFLILVVALSGRHGYEVGRAEKEQKGAKKVQKRCKRVQKGAILTKKVQKGAF